MLQVMVCADVLMVQVLTFTGAGRLLQTPWDWLPQVSCTVPVGVTPPPVHVVTEVNTMLAPIVMEVGLAVAVVLVGVLPVTEKVVVPVEGAKSVSPEYCA